MKNKDKQIIFVKKGKEFRYPYCKKCRRAVKPIRRIKNDLYSQIWGITIIASLGILLPIFLIYHFLIKKKKYCPRCSNPVKFYESNDKLPGSKAQITRIIKQIDMGGKPDIIECPYCREKIDKSLKYCPSCGIALNELKL
ncbi:MAG: zinc-ribbon domain-containing protein [Candidatus Lokiarchaeota archaeon]|nr:zinc-ribbon domain-containing protein [Candidatus Lokiarchaeota archaeon]